MSTSNSLLVLSAADVKRVATSFTSDSLMDVMANAFVQLTNRKGVKSPQRIVIDNDATRLFTLFMPTHAEGFGTAIKVVSLPSSTSTGRKIGLSASTLVLDEETGAVKAILNAKYLTSLRTAAGSCLATKLLCKREPLVLVAFGAGGQIYAHVQLLLSTFPSLKECIIVNRTQNDRLTQLKADLELVYKQATFSFIAASYGDSIDSDAILESVVSMADIICTATSSVKALFRTEWVKTGVHINLVGSYTPQMQEVDKDLICRASRVAVDSKDACLHEAGELIQAGLPRERLVEVGELLDETGQPLDALIDEVKRGDVTIFKSVGVGIQDVAIAQAVLTRAQETGIGANITGFDD